VTATPRGFALVLVLTAGCRPACTPPPGDTRPNVVLVTVDTLRADHLGCYGSPVVRTPHLDRLAAEGTLFERCYAHTHVTVPSHLTILSSLPPAEHGVLTNDKQAARPVEALPALFARAGYRTAAFVSVKHLGPEWTLGPLLAGGLEVYHAPRRMSVPARAADTNRELFHWLHGACGGPFFAWVHYWDPHMPYEPPPPFDTAYYQGDPYDPHQTSMGGVTFGWFFYETGGVRRILAERAGDLRSLKRTLGTSGRRTRQLILHPDGLAAYALSPEVHARVGGELTELAALLRRRLPLRAKLADWLTGVTDIRFPLGRYAGEVSYVDQEMGHLRAELERLGIADRTILVVTADHGESLGEHGLYFDHFGLQEANLRVPLIVWAPGRVQAGRRRDIVAGLDIAPTLLALAALPASPAMRGRDLFAEGGTSEPVVAESTGGLQLMIHDGRWKLVRTVQGFYYTDSFAPRTGATELYDSEADPREQTDLAAVHADVVAALGSRLDDWLAAHYASRDGMPSRPVSPQEERELRALGYVE
jgi:arylsulfatase A-like enzyme